MSVIFQKNTPLSHSLTYYGLPVFPLIFHSIADEIPEASRPLITRIFQLWLVLFGTLIINLVTCIIILISGVEGGGGDLGGSLGSVCSARSLE